MRRLRLRWRRVWRTLRATRVSVVCWRRNGRLLFASRERRGVAGLSHFWPCTADLHVSLLVVAPVYCRVLETTSSAVGFVIHGVCIYCWCFLCDNPSTDESVFAVVYCQRNEARHVFIPANRVRRSPTAGEVGWKNCSLFLAPPQNATKKMKQIKVAFQERVNRVLSVKFLREKCGRLWPRVDVDGRIKAENRGKNQLQT